MVDWEGVNEFVAVAETTSFTAAAQRLGTSVAQVSRRISQLENRLDVQLFQRTTRKVTITEEGRVYYNHCRQVLDGLREAERAVTSLQRQPSGKLRITAPVSYGEIYVAPLEIGRASCRERVWIAMVSGTYKKTIMKFIER